MKRIFLIMLWAGIVSVLFSCTDNGVDGLAESIRVDVTQARKIYMRGDSTEHVSQYTELGKATGNVKDIFVIDTSIYIFHGQTISVFDDSGAFAGNISRVGRAGNEYVSLWYAFEEAGNVVIYDMNGRKMLVYSPATNSVEEKSLPDEMKRFFQALHPFDGGYVAKLGFNGNADISEELGYFDANFEFQDTIGSLKLNSGLWLGRPFSDYNGQVLYWRQLDNTVYSIDSHKRLKERYNIDFLKKNVPSDREFADDYEKIEFINASPGSYATYLSYVLETDVKLYFTFIYSSNKYLAVYDKAAGVTVSYKLQFGDGEVLNNIIPLESGVFVVADKVDGGSVLYVLDL